MTKEKRTRKRILGLVSISLVIAAATYGFASMNTTIHGAGMMDVGYGIVSSSDVSRVIYTLDVDDPSLFTAVEFILDGDGPVVVAGVSTTKNGQITWADECEKTGTSWYCTFKESRDVLSADWLHVSTSQ
jgi:hypothetical protein